MLHFAYKISSTYCSIQNNLVLLIILLRRGTNPHYFLQVLLFTCLNQQDQWVPEHNTENMCRSIFSWDWRWMELFEVHVQWSAWVLAPVNNWVLLPQNNHEVWLVTMLWAGWFDSQQG